MPHEAYLQEQINNASGISYGAIYLVNAFFLISIGWEHQKAFAVEQTNPFPMLCYLYITI